MSEQIQCLSASDLPRTPRVTKFTNSFPVGMRNNSLTVLGYERRRHWHLVVRCDCGKERIQSASNFLRNKSCGCLTAEDHGATRTTTYIIWMGIRSRCGNPAHISYERYGGRGIAVCDRWAVSYKNFVADMGERPPGKSLDRIDNSGDYEPGNCRWATPKEQMRNKRDNRLITFGGITKCVAAWSEEAGIPRRVIYDRLRRGWSAEDALTKPIKVSEKRAAPHQPATITER